ncbi:MAG: hypothetical protein ACREA2_24795 [Blastocatellia bacterium]
METDAKSLLTMIQEFIVKQDIPLAYWELIVGVDAATLRGSFSPSPPEGAVLNQLPPPTDEPLDSGFRDAYREMIQEDKRNNTGVPATYFRDAETYLDVLTLSKQELLKYTLRASNISNTGICGETANKLAVILSGELLGRGGLNELIGALEMDARPRIYGVVSIGRSHRFLVEKIAGKVTLLQSWVGRFSLAKWVAEGRTVWDLREFVGALKAALPENRNPLVNAPYNQLFNVPGVTQTPSPHDASEVTVEIYQTPGNNAVRENLRNIYLEDSKRWQ